MKFGICCPADFIPAASAAGFDYVELGVSTALLPERATGEHISELQSLLAKNSLESEALNLMLPGGFHCVGHDVDEKRLALYFQTALERAATVGAQTVVFGSGTQRTVPDGLPYEVGRAQYKQAVRLAGNEAAKYGIVIAIEPLIHLESNLINSVAEGHTLAIEIDHPSVKVLSDLYHVETDHQPFSETIDAGSLLAHVHVAGAGRRAPIDDDIPVLREFFNAVKAAGYHQRVSIEANWTDMAAQADEALAAVVKAWSQA